MTQDSAQDLISAYDLLVAALQLAAIARVLPQLTARDYQLIDQMVADLTQISRKLAVIDRRGGALQDPRSV
jgi:hypothetical protein